MRFPLDLGLLDWQVFRPDLNLAHASALNCYGVGSREPTSDFHIDHRVTQKIEAIHALHFADRLMQQPSRFIFDQWRPLARSGNLQNSDPISYINGNSITVRESDFANTFCLTFEMSGGAQRVKPAAARPLDGWIRRHQLCYRLRTAASTRLLSSRSLPPVSPTGVPPCDRHAAG